MKQEILVIGTLFIIALLAVSAFGFWNKTNEKTKLVDDTIQNKNQEIQSVWDQYKVLDNKFVELQNANTNLTAEYNKLLDERSRLYGERDNARLGENQYSRQYDDALASLNAVNNQIKEDQLTIKSSQDQIDYLHDSIANLQQSISNLETTAKTQSDLAQKWQKEAENWKSKYDNSIRIF